MNLLVVLIILVIMFSMIEAQTGNDGFQNLPGPDETTTPVVHHHGGILGVIGGVAHGALNLAGGLAHGAVNVAGGAAHAVGSGVDDVADHVTQGKKKCIIM